MSRDIDFTKKLSAEDEQYVRMRGNPHEMRMAGLLPEQDFSLASVPDSLEPHELENRPEPAFDMDSEVAKESVGEPGAEESTRISTHAAPPPTEQEPYKADDEKATAAKQGSASAKSSTK